MDLFEARKSILKKNEANLWWRLNQKWAKGSLKMKREKRVEWDFWFGVLCGELMKCCFESENWRSNGWIMIWVIDFNKKMSERWRDLRKKMERYYSLVRERDKNKWRTSEEKIIWKCLMKIKSMGICLSDWFWHKNGWEKKRNWMKMERAIHGFGERKNKCRTWKEESKRRRKEKKIWETCDQAASRLLSGLRTVSKRLAAWLLSICTIVAFRLILINPVIIL